MKTPSHPAPLTLVAGLLAALAAVASPDIVRAQNTTTAGGDSVRISIDAQSGQPKSSIPTAFFAAVENVLTFAPEEVTGEATIKLRILNAGPAALALGLLGTGDVVAVKGDGLRDWAVRQDGAKRFLDLRLALKEGAPAPTELTVAVTTRLRKPAFPGRIDPLWIAPGEAVGFSSRITLKPAADVELRVVQATGLMPVGTPVPPHSDQQLFTNGEGALSVEVARRGALARDADFTQVELVGQAGERSVEFRMRGTAQVAREGARIPVLGGNAAPSDAGSGDGWHLEYAKASNQYEIVFDRIGSVPVELKFAAAIAEQGGWQQLAFRMPAGAVVPLVLEGLGGAVTFDTAAQVAPTFSDGKWKGFVPASGLAGVSWKRDRQSGEGTLFFTTQEQTTVRIGAGVLRQQTGILAVVLQGKLPALRLRLSGPGEILAVEGKTVAAWEVIAGANGERTLNVRLTQPTTGSVDFVVRSQLALGTFPVRTEPLRMTPEGATRHSGKVWISNTGAVRLEVVDAKGMMQLAPEQFGARPAKEPGERQVFVFRFPSATYDYRVTADQILPEVGVSQVTTYQLGETDRVVASDIELDIREAPLRDWSFTIPADHAIVALTGAEVADYAAESEARDGVRVVKVIFGKAVEGLQLIRLRLEKNQPAAAGNWQLPPLGFPEAKSVRGHLGVVSVPGYRIVPGKTEKLAEVPLTYFPAQIRGLQQAYRLREPGWTASFVVEALGQSVQADVFHLYSLREGVAYGSVLLNYFVVGSPATEWRIEIPKTAANVDVTGQNVRRDWRQEGGQLIVPLHQPVLGSATLLVTFEEPMSARGGDLKPGAVRPLGVQGERGYVQIVSPSQVKHEVLKAEGGLLKVEPQELPAEFRLLTTSPSLLAYQYTGRPFELAVDVRWYDPGEMVDQLIDFARFSSRVARDGQTVTDARFFVKTRGQKALRLDLPKSARLWEVRVDGAEVNARADGGQILVPLPARADPNQSVEVALRMGQKPGRFGKPALVSPTMQAPMVIGEWSVHADTGRLLLPKGGDAKLVSQPLTETGLQWVSARAPYRTLAVLLAACLAAALLGRAGAGWMRRIGGLAIGLIALMLAVSLALEAISLGHRRPNRAHLEYASAVIPAGDVVAINVASVAPWRAMVSWGGVLAALAGAALLGRGMLARNSAGGVGGMPSRVAGTTLIAAGLLAQRGGAAAFFGALALVAAFAILLPGIRRWIRWSREVRVARARAIPAAPDSTTGGVAPSTSALLALLAALGCSLLAPVATFAAEARQAVPPAAETIAESMLQSWRIEGGRLFGTCDLKVRGRAGDSVVVLRAPATLTAFEGPGLRVTRSDRNGEAYIVALERDGGFAARMTFEMPVGALGRNLTIPTGPAAVQRIAIDCAEPGWEFGADGAIALGAGPRANPARSQATLVFGPGAPGSIRMTPRPVEAAPGTTQFFVETSNLFLPVPGAVTGRHRITVRPVQGRVAELEVEVPEGFTVGEVAGGPVGEWRYDPATRRLRVVIGPPQSEPFAVDVETQRGTEALPADLELAPLRLTGAAGEVGMVGIAFGGDAQPENVRPSGLSPVSLGDFDPGLLPRVPEGQPAVTLQHVYRYGKEPAVLRLRAAAVAPEVRVAVKQMISLGDDRLVLAADLDVAITRAGLFKLSFVLPDKLEVESISGAALSHWAEAGEGATRVVTLHLQGRTIGQQTFAIALAGPAPGPQEEWAVPRIALREATRQTGELTLVPEKGIRLRAGARNNVSPVDARAGGEMRPGSIAFRLLQENWSLKVAIETLAPWVTIQSLQEITVREGQTLTRLSLKYRIDNAAVKQLGIRLPGLTDEQARTVRATGPTVSDLVQRTGNGTDRAWDIRFQRGLTGEADVVVEWQGASAGDKETQLVEVPGFEGVRQVAHFVAIRATGRLELDTPDAPRGWQRADWREVPAGLQNPGERGVPALCFRVAEPEGPLPVRVRRHDVADALKLRVTSAELTTLFSPRGAYLTSVDLQIAGTAKTTLRVRLPEGARLFNTSVNGETVAVVRDGDAFLFHVAPGAVNGRGTAPVRMVYGVPAPRSGGIRLVGPVVNLPLENVTWRTILPPGYELDRHKGGLRLLRVAAAGRFGMGDYQQAASAKREEDNKKASALLAEANQWLQKGQQDKAGEALSRVSKAKGLDEASNEDARVQLRALKTQQAVLGLNTRRQKMYLDNGQQGGGAVRNEQLEQAANINPFLQGQTNFDPAQVDQLLMGNTVDENAALRGIATRIVDQQLAVDTAPGAIDVTLPARGSVATFTRSLQVETDAPLTLQLGVSAPSTFGKWTTLCALALVAALAGILVRRREGATAG
jgi:hypothetical protein